MAIQSKHQQTATTVRAPTNYEVPAWHPTPVQCSAQKPPDMQIRLDSIYCPAECQLFPILGWLGSPFRVPRCRIQLFGWETATGSPTTQWQAHSRPAARNHEHQHHDRHLEPHGNFRQVMICLDTHVDECRCVGEYFCWRTLPFACRLGATFATEIATKYWRRSI